MSDHRDNQPSSSSTVLVIVAAVVVVVTIAAIALIAVAIDDGARATSMIALVVGPLTALFAFLGLFAQQQGMRQQLHTVEQHTTELTNGVGDAKIRTRVADVLRPDLIDPNMTAQLEADRTRLAAKEAAAEILLARLDRDYQRPTSDEAPDLD